MSFWKNSLILLLLVVPTIAGAFYIEYKGIVTEFYSGDAMGKVKVRVYKKGELQFYSETRGNGKYSFKVDREADYVVVYSRKGFVSKRVAIDTHGVPPIPDVPFYEMFVQISLFAWVPNMDFSLFEDPLGLAVYKPSVRNMAWDNKYSKRMDELLVQLMRDYERASWKTERKVLPEAPLDWPPPAQRGQKEPKYKEP